LDRKFVALDELRQHLRDGIDQFSRRGKTHDDEWNDQRPGRSFLVIDRSNPECLGRTKPVDFPNYQAGTWGPEAAEVLIAQDGRSWMQPVVQNDYLVPI